MNLFFYLICSGFLLLSSAKAEVNSYPEFTFRQPASDSFETRRDYLLELTGKVIRFEDQNTVTVSSDQHGWEVGNIVAVESQFNNIGVIAFLEVARIKKNNNKYDISCTLLRGTRKSFVQAGDSVFKVDLTGQNTRYLGSTELLVKKSQQVISSKYQYLVTQGVSIGETAQTLQKDEVLSSWYSQINYGLTDDIMFGTILLGNLAGAPNVNGKWRFFSSETNVFSLGLNVAKIPSEARTTVNATVFWDSISSGSVIGHTYLSLALLSLENAQDATAIKAFGSSSIQSGYEFILDDWNRVLTGPVYNFENKAVGGYLGYMKIWDRFHFLLVLNSTNITEFRPSTKNGYYLFFDAFWRF